MYKILNNIALLNNKTQKRMQKHPFFYLTIKYPLFVSIRELLEFLYK